MWHKIHKIISLYKHKLYNSITIQGCVRYVETNWSTCHVVRKTKGWKWGLGIMFKFFHVILMSGGDLRTTDLKMKFQFLITAGRFLQGWAPIDLLFLITLRPSDCEHVLTKAHAVSFYVNRSCFLPKQELFPPASLYPYSWIHTCPFPGSPWSSANFC